MEKKLYSMGFWDTNTMFHCSIFVFLVLGLTTLIVYGNNNNLTTMNSSTRTTYSKTQLVFEDQKRAPASLLMDSCDLFSGRWVYDNKSYYPLYREHECPYLQHEFACQTYGRKDSKYLQWRWQPHGCSFPRFDGNAIVEKLKGRRLLFVGDSLNRNQWSSMVCMLQSYIHGTKIAGSGLNGTLHTFSATDYNISIDFYWAPMLVESNGDSPTDHHRDERIIQIDSIDKHARHWVDADILVFNSYHWWRFKAMKLLFKADVESLLDDPNQKYEEVEYLRAYKLGLDTWSKWVQTHIDLSKTKLFFMGATATHSRAKDWGNKGNCYGETEPIMEDGFWESGTDRKMLNVLDSSLRELQAKGVNVAIINITQLTQSRKDAHTTIYKKEYRLPLIELQQKNPQRASDCSHWCLPGVPDIWNELLLANIFKETKPTTK